MKKYLFLFLMNLTIITSINAQFGGGTGTSVDPYLISTKSHLEEIRTGLGVPANLNYDNKFFLQTNNIDLGGSSTPWAPLSGNFQGTYDGGNYSITGVYINTSIDIGSNTRSGFFDYLGFAEIKNLNIVGELNLTDANVNAGLFVGQSLNSTFTNCSASGTVSTPNNSSLYTGGFVGYLQRSHISNSFSSVVVTSAGTCGGFVGYLFEGSTVKQSFSTGNVTTSSGFLRAGGFVGEALPNGLGSTAIENCYSKGNASGGSNGSFAGHNYINITNCYSTGSATRFVNFNSGTVSNCFYNSDYVGFTTTGATGLTTAQMKIESNFTNAGWDFFGETTNGTNDYWNISSSVNDGYPGLSWQNYTYNYALSFDGTNDYVEIPNNSVLTPTNYVTVEVLAKSNTSTWNSDGMLVSKRDQFVMHPNQATKTIVFYVNIGGSWYAASFDLTVDISEWHHYAGTYDGSNIKLFVDGTEVSSTPQTGLISSGVTGNLYIGADQDVGGRFFNGQIDEVRIWDIARTQTQINDNKSIELNGNESGLVAYYKMSNGSGTTLSDNKTTGSPYDGTIYNGAAWTKIIDVANMPLPVELTSFTANVAQNNVVLNWQTATEVNNYGFEVQKSVVSSQNSEDTLSGVEEWEAIGFVQGHGTTNSPKNYEFTDSELPDVDEVSYRLKQIDNDGTFAYSKTITVDLTTITSVEDEEIPTVYSLEQNYPNPFNPTTTIKFSIASEAKQSVYTTLKIYNMLGQEVRTLVNQKMQAGYHEVNFDASNLSSGMYIYKLTSGNFTQTKKLMLLK